jgi:hypothetical protein
MTVSSTMYYYDHFCGFLFGVYPYDISECMVQIILNTKSISSAR